MSVEGQTVERHLANSRLREIVERTATVLRSPAHRAALSQLLGNSRIAEQKVDFSWLARSVESPLFADLEPELREALGSLADQTVPLEAYFPIATHRAQWVGGGNLIVAGQLTEHDQIFAFDLNGNEIELSEAAVPTTPTLMIVQSETQFGERPSFAICDPEVSDCGGGGGGGGSSIQPAGLWLRYSFLEDLHEPWTRGSPEIEASLVGPLSDTMDVHLISCAGEDRVSPRRFNQDDHLWTGYVLLADSTQLSQARSAYGNVPWSDTRFTVAIWEDDYVKCEYHGSEEDWSDHILYTALAVGAGYIAVSTEFDEWCDDQIPCALLLGGLAALQHFVGAIFDGSNDDIVGTTVSSEAWLNAGGDAVSSEAVLLLEGSYAGELRFCIRAFHQPNLSCQ